MHIWAVILKLYLCSWEENKKAVLYCIINPKPTKIPGEQSNTMILIVHPESKHQALLCPIDVLRSSCKCNGGQVEERWSVPFMNGISGNEV